MSAMYPNSKMIFELQQTALTGWQRPFETNPVWPWTVTNEAIAGLLQQQAAVQRLGLEMMRPLVHLGYTNAMLAISGGESMGQPIHTVIDDQFDLLATLHTNSIEAMLAAYTRRSAAEAPINRTIGTGAAESPPTDAAPEPEEDSGEDAEPADSAIEYAEIVEGTIPEVKERVETEEVDIEQVIAAERAGKARVTLLEWLEK